jgi:hypothetical protein
MNRRDRNIALIVAAVISGVPSHPVRAQETDRLPAAIDARNRVRLKGSRSARVDKSVSEGPVEDSMSVPGITLHFRPTAQQSDELDQLLADQQDPSSPRYHAWLTPEEFGRRFGLSVNDFARVRDWVESQGFRIQRAAHQFHFPRSPARLRINYHQTCARRRFQGV